MWWKSHTTTKLLKIDDKENILQAGKANTLIRESRYHDNSSRAGLNST